MTELVVVKVPDIGDFKDVPVIEVHVKPGDTVEAETALITLESDKATMDVPAPAAGVVKELWIKVGDKVSEGSPVLNLDTSGRSETEVTVADAAPTPPKPAPAPSPAAAGAAAITEVRVPDIGDFKDVPVIELHVKPGDTIKADDPVVTLESDKATMDVPSSASGTVAEVKVKLGDKVGEGTLLIVVSTGATTAPSPPRGEGRGEGVAPAAPPPPAPPALSAPPSPPTPLPDGARGEVTAPAGRAHASPSVRRFARELGVDVSKVPGSGPKGRILQQDVQNFVKGVMAQVAGTAAPVAAAAAGGGLSLLPWPQVDFAKFGPVETKPLARIKKISAANLHRNWVMIPHVTNHDEADITDLEAFRLQWNKENEKSGVKLSMLAFMIKAACATLKKFPEFNASLDGDNLVLKNYWHIGFAADTPNGLVVPVIRDADRKGVAQIAQEMGELAKLAREGKLKPDQMQGGTFTISSLGGIGGTYFTPIINAPEVAILGVCKSFHKPVWDGTQFAPRLMLPLSLSWDHRVIDGASAARFNVHFAGLLADMRRVLM